MAWNIGKNSLESRITTVQHRYGFLGTRWNGRNLFFLGAVLLICTGLSIGFYQANALPSISIFPAGGAPGSTVTITGWGFANSTLTSVFFDNALVGEKNTSPSGTFDKAITVPSNAMAGHHRISANDGVNSGDAIFTVTSLAVLSITPERGTTGTTVTVSGSHFGAVKAITLKFDSINIVTPSDFRSSGNGTFSATFAIPSTATMGSHTISATDGSVSAVRIFDVSEATSLLTLSANSASVGTVVALAGTGFSANSLVTIKMDSTTLATFPSSVATNSLGSFSTYITVPTGVAPGTKTISAIDGSGRATWSTFVIARSGTVTLSLSSSAGGTAVTVSGSDFNPNSPITIKFDSSTLATTPASIIASSGGTFSAIVTIPTGIAPGTNIISAIDGSGTVGSTVFTITETGPFSLSKRVGIPGTPITISGSGYNHGSVITIKFDHITLEASPSPVVTSVYGNFEAVITIPEDASTGSHTISVIDSAGRTNTLLFTVARAGVLKISPTTGTVGSELTITGSNFVNGTRLSIRFNDITVRTFPNELTSSAMGKFIAKVHVPDNISEGTYRVFAEDSNGGTGIGTFNVTGNGLSIKLAPTSGRNAPMSITGTGFASKMPIKISFDGEVVPTEPTRVNTTSSGSFTASFFIPGNAPNGNHTISALDGNSTASTFINLRRQHIDDRYGILISLIPQKYNFNSGETLLITGKVLALDNSFPLLLKVFNPNNSACSFQQLQLEKGMTFTAKPVMLGGEVCSVNGEYKISAHYGKGKALTKFNVGVTPDELTGGQAEVINAQVMPTFLRFDNRYPVDLDWATNAVLVRNNMNQTITFYLVFAEFDANEITRKVSYKEVTIQPFKNEFVIAPFAPLIIDGKPNGYLHVFAWTSMNNLSPLTPLHPGLYVPY